MSEQCTLDTRPSVAAIFLAAPASGRINLCREHFDVVAAALGIGDALAFFGLEFKEQV